MINLDEEKIERISSYMKACNSIAGWWFGHNEVTECFYINTDKNRGYCACHAPIKTTLANDNLSFFASNGSYGKKTANWADKPQVGELVTDTLEWILGPESPWRNIHQNDVHIIRDEDKFVRGFILGDKALEDKSHRGGIYNLLVAARFSRDYYWIFHNMSDLKTKLGMGRLPSLLLAPYLAFRENKWVSNGALGWDAAHTPFREFRVPNKYNYYLIDRSASTQKEANEILSIQRLKNGDFDFAKADTNMSSCGWLDPRKAGEETLSEQVGKVFKVTKTKFSEIRTIEENAIVDLAKRIEA